MGIRMLEVTQGRMQCCERMCPRHSSVSQIGEYPFIGKPSLMPATPEPIGWDRSDKRALLKSTRNPKALTIMGKRIGAMLTAAQVPPEEAVAVGKGFIQELGPNTDFEAIQQTGERWRIIFEERGYTTSMDELFMDRNRWVAGLIVPRLKPGSVLDHDSGDSYVARFVQDQRLDVTVHTQDAFDFRREITNLPFVLYPYSTKRLPYPDGAFDQAILATVLHHCDDPERMFDEVDRVVKSPKRLFLFENVFPQKDGTEKRLNVLFDWFFNTVAHKSGLPLPYSHFCPEQWEYFLDQKGYTITERLDLGQNPVIPLNHVLFVAEKG